MANEFGRSRSVLEVVSGAKIRAVWGNSVAQTVTDWNLRLYSFIGTFASEEAFNNWASDNVGYSVMAKDWYIVINDSNLEVHYRDSTGWRVRIVSDMPYFYTGSEPTNKVENKTMWYDGSELKYWTGSLWQVLSSPVTWDNITGKPTTLSGFGITDNHYEYTQGISSDTWVITHNLERKPIVVVFDSAGDEVIGLVTHNSTNQLTITFSSAFTGRAYLT